MSDASRQRAGPGWWAAALGGYVASRLLAWGVFDLAFDDNPLLWFWQYLDPALLRDDVWTSLLYHHAQPPLFNLYLSAVTKTCGDPATECFQASYVAIGVGLHLGLFALMLRLGVDRRLALGTTWLFAFAPASMLYEHWLFYTYPMAAVLVGAAVALHRAVAGGGRTRDLALFTGLAAVAVLTRSLFHLVWLAGALALVAWPLRANGRRLVAVAALPVVLCVAVYAKNAVLFGEFSSSSWLGMSVARLAIEPIPLPERRALVAEGTIGRVSLVRPFSPVDAYPPGLRRGAPDGHPVLADARKSTRAPNYNHGAYLAIGRAYRRDAGALIRARPGVYADSVARAWSRFAMAPSILLFLRTNRERLGGYAEAFTAGLYGFVLPDAPPAGPGARPELRYEARAHSAVYLLLAAGSVLVAGVRGLREWGRRTGDAALGATLLFAAGTAAYVGVVGNALELGENNRFRFMVEPLLFALIAWLADGLRRRPGAARRAAPVAVAVVTAALAVGCPAPPDRPNVVLVVLDTTRADALSSYGNPRETTPRIDALASEGVRFERAYSTDFWTLPSHASLMTGLYPSQHGATSETNHLPEGPPTLAERLAEAGYRTAAFVSNPFVSRERGFARGFGVYREGWAREPEPATAWVMDRLALAEGLEWIDAAPAADRAPFFLFFNWNSAHLPYQPDPLRHVALHPEPLDPNRAAMLKRITGGWAMYGGGLVLDEADFAALRGLYEAEVAALDGLVGELVDALAARGLLDDTLLIVTSDHGEAFGEHGLIDHLPAMYETTVRIPLVVRLPERFPAGAVRPDLVSLVDVAPTVLDVVGLGAPDAPAGGRSLVRNDSAAPPFVVAENERPLRGVDMLRRAYPDLDLGVIDHRLRMLRDDTHKLIWREGRGVELYDLVADPGEQHDLAERDPATRERLLSTLRTWMAERAAAAPPPAEPFETQDARARAQLRALGYIE